jgi:hypothetical protein
MRVCGGKYVRRRIAFAHLPNIPDKSKLPLLARVHFWCIYKPDAVSRSEIVHQLLTAARMPKTFIAVQHCGGVETIQSTLLSSISCDRRW